MRKDLNKLLCERERAGSSTRTYKNSRRNKKFTNPGQEGENLRSFESTMFRHSHTGNTRDFSENLNPLKGAVRAAVGQRWDTFYGELSKVFDKRSVINQHILQHLYQYIEKDLYIEDGELYINDNQYRSHKREPTKLRNSSTEFYVDPRDGIIKKNKYLRTQRQAARMRAAENKRESLEIRRDIDNKNVLHKIDGIWYHFTLEQLPKGKIVFEKPVNQDVFELKSWDGKLTVKTWDKLSDYEKTKHGIKRFSGEKARDVFTDELVYIDPMSGQIRITKWNNRGYSPSHTGMYHATKQSASHKMLKKAGII